MTNAVLELLGRRFRASPGRYAFVACPRLPGEPPRALLGLCLALRARGWSVALYASGVLVRGDSVVDA